jgi:hypothetical protein
MVATIASHLDQLLGEGGPSVNRRLLLLLGAHVRKRWRNPFARRFDTAALVACGSWARCALGMGSPERKTSSTQALPSGSAVVKP